MKIDDIAKKFNFEGELIKIKQNNQGNINKTYILEYSSCSYIIQQINNYVFKNPLDVMHNIELISNYLKKEINNKQKVLELIYTIDNKNCLFINDEYYRAYKYIKDSISYDKLNSQEDAYQIGKAFGYWEKMLKDFPVQELKTTIPNFHNTDSYYQKFLESIKKNYQNRAGNLKDIVEEIINSKQECSQITSKLGKTIPFRVSHNDTKVNNILIDQKTKKPICVIDLDTVMQGSILFDLGDGIRSACNNTYEDDNNYENSTLNIEYTKNYLKGFLEETHTFLTIDEVNNMVKAIEILTLELVIRFLTDYLNGDVYFKTNYPEHNKVRTLNQLHLYHDIIKHRDELNQYVINLYNENPKTKNKILH